MSSTSPTLAPRASGLRGKTIAAIGAIRALWGLTVPAGVTDAIVAALRWLNNPWKFVALLGFGITALFGAIVWDQRVMLVTVLVENPARSQELAVDRERAAGVLVQLLRNTGGAIATVSAWDIEQNRRTTLVAINRAGRQLTVEPETLPIIRSPRLPSVILPSLLAGDVPCIQILPPTPPGELDRIPPDIRILASSEGLVAYCVGPISDRGALLGSLTVLFASQPADTSQVAVAMRTTAAALLRRVP